MGNQGDYANVGLIRAELRAIAASQPSHCAGKWAVGLPVLTAFGDDSGAAAEIVQFEVEDGKFGRRNSVTFVCRTQAQTEEHRAQ
jgi:hypothetical protein